VPAQDLHRELAGQRVVEQPAARPAAGRLAGEEHRRLVDRRVVGRTSSRRATSVTSRSYMSRHVVASSSAVR
jgi:hypothetical protein